MMKQMSGTSSVPRIAHKIKSGDKLLTTIRSLANLKPSPELLAFVGFEFAVNLCASYFSVMNYSKSILQ